MTLQMSSCHDLSVCQLCQTPNSANSGNRWKSFTFFWQPQLLSAYQRARSEPRLQTFSEPVWVRAWVCVYFPYGCSRSPLNKTVVPLLSKPTSFVSNEHLPGSLPTTAGFSVSPCQQPMTLICCFITPKRCVCV